MLRTCTFRIGKSFWLSATGSGDELDCRRAVVWYADDGAGQAVASPAR